MNANITDKQIAQSIIEGAYVELAATRRDNEELLTPAVYAELIKIAAGYGVKLPRDIHFMLSAANINTDALASIFRDAVEVATEECGHVVLGYETSGLEGDKIEPCFFIATHEEQAIKIAASTNYIPAYASNYE